MDNIKPVQFVKRREERLGQYNKTLYNNTVGDRLDEGVGSTAPQPIPFLSLWVMFWHECPARCAGVREMREMSLT